MTDTPKHSVSVAGVVVHDDGRVLVIRRRDNGHWEPPGGILELSEGFEEGVKREVLEETGLTVQVERLTGVYKNMTRGVVNLVFRCRPIDTPNTTSTEAATIQWRPLVEIVELMDEAYAIRVQDALDDGPHFRVHDGTRLAHGQPGSP